MRKSCAAVLGLWLLGAEAINHKDIARRYADHPGRALMMDGSQILGKRADNVTHGPYYNDKTAEFWVDGSAGSIPDVDFDVDESFAGLLPISSDANDTQQLWWWFWPSRSEEDETIVIWLNGGPGCSSLEGFLQENGPFLWQYGTYKPVPNPYTWINLTSMIWVEQPVGTGFTQGEPTATNEDEVAEQFLGFWKNFVDTFDLQGKKIYVTGESYAGYYVPYIVSHMQEKNDTEYYDARGSLFYDPSLTYDVIQQQIPALPFAKHHQNLFNLNETYLAELEELQESCGYAAYLEEYLTYPPAGPLPSPPQIDTTDECDLFTKVFDAVLLINPCFDVYQVATTCPLLWDVLGFPGSFEYLPEGTEIYFNRTEVQEAINAPIGEWAECAAGDVFGGDGNDHSIPSSLSVLPGVIERSDRTIIGHGMLDMILMQNGTLLAIQNMTWGGDQGFQTEPSDPFIVPWDSQGIMGRTTTERGLTYVEIELSGHMVPQYQPQSAYRQLEFLLGKIDDLSSW